MKDVIKSKGARAAYDLLVSSAIIESAISVKEIDPGDKIGFLPENSKFDYGVNALLKEQGYEIPTDNCGHYGGIHMGYANTKGYGTLEILLDFNDLFVFNYTKQDVQLDYGRVYYDTMSGWLEAFSTILNSSKSLRKKRMEIKKEYKDETYQNDISFYSNKTEGQSESK
tara:strand:- start:1385 stop:1891 length:507 start_codon:yes stop_codon:yes gene_type:complete